MKSIAGQLAVLVIVLVVSLPVGWLFARLGLDLTDHGLPFAIAGLCALATAVALAAAALLEKPYFDPRIDPRRKDDDVSET